MANWKINIAGFHTVNLVNMKLWLSAQIEETITGRQPEHKQRPESSRLPGIINRKYSYTSGSDACKIKEMAEKDYKKKPSIALFN